MVTPCRVSCVLSRRATGAPEVWAASSDERVISKKHSGVRRTIFTGASQSTAGLSSLLELGVKQRDGGNSCGQFSFGAEISAEKCRFSAADASPAPRVAQLR